MYRFLFRSTGLTICMGAENCAPRIWSPLAAAQLRENTKDAPKYETTDESAFPLFHRWFCFTVQKTPLKAHFLTDFLSV